MIGICSTGWISRAVALLAMSLAVAAPPNAAAKKKKGADTKAKSSAKGDEGDESSSASQSSDKAADKDEADKDKKVVKTNAEWRRQLTRQQFEVTRLKETEPPFTGKYARSKKDGVYHCVCCGKPLFDSRAKFESGTGWPSFYEPLDKDAVQELPDLSEGVPRTEVQCSRCDAHLGHVFSDGPEPTGLRYCMNSASLKFVDRNGKTAPKNAKSKKGKPAAKTSKSAKSKSDEASDHESADGDEKK